MALAPCSGRAASGGSAACSGRRAPTCMQGKALGGRPQKSPRRHDRRACRSAPNEVSAPGRTRAACRRVHALACIVAPIAQPTTARGDVSYGNQKRCAPPLFALQEPATASTAVASQAPALGPSPDAGGRAPGGEDRGPEPSSVLQLTLSTVESMSKVQKRGMHVGVVACGMHTSCMHHASMCPPSLPCPSGGWPGVCSMECKCCCPSANATSRKPTHQHPRSGG